MDDGNVVQRATALIAVLKARSAAYRHRHLLVPFGDDFKFRNAELQFSNMGRIVRYIQEHSAELKVWAQFSSLSDYFTAAHSEGTIPSTAGRLHAIRGQRTKLLDSHNHTHTDTHTHTYTLTHTPNPTLHTQVDLPHCPPLSPTSSPLLRCRPLPTFRAIIPLDLSSKTDRACRTHAPPTTHTQALDAVLSSPQQLLQSMVMNAAVCAPLLIPPVSVVMVCCPRCVVSCCVMCGCVV